MSQPLLAIRMKRALVAVAIYLAAGGLATAAAQDDEPPAPIPQAGPVAMPISPGTILDAYSYWRAVVTVRPIVYAEKTEGAAAPDGYPRSDPPPADWFKPDFDDGAWFRACGPVFGSGGGYGWERTGGGAQETSLLCLRGRFNVPDPAKVESLNLSVAYRGGIVVYLNGQEVARGQLGQGAVTPDTLATEYPWDAYVNPDGKSPLDYHLAPASRTKEQAERLELRVRRLSNVSIPSKHLTKGVNVLAIEVHRAPVDPKARGLTGGSAFRWSTMGLNEIALTATPPESVPSNTARPKGIQVWNENPVADVFGVDYGDPNEPLRPIRLVGARNGSFSGWVVVGSDGPVKGLSATMSDLKTADGKGTIASQTVRVRYPLATGYGGQEGREYLGFRMIRRFDAIAESLPPEVPVAKFEVAKGYTGPLPVAGAVQPIRVTVRVPADVAPGDYEGTLTIRAEGLSGTAVPVKLQVADWTLPDVCDFRTAFGVIQSVESLVLHYKVPLWSEEHWKLMERSYRYLGENGADSIFLPLVEVHHFGKNAFVRWVKNADGTYSQNYDLFDRYVDLALKYLKKPKVVCLYVWDPKHAAGRGGKDEPPRPVPVPLLDPATGQVTTLNGPAYGTEEYLAAWKPIIETCREKLKARGVPESAIMLGMNGDFTPPLEHFKIFKRTAPWVIWVRHAHEARGGYSNRDLDIKMMHAAGVWGVTEFPDPSVKRNYGWKRDDIVTAFPREGAGATMLVENTPLAGCLIGEESLLLANLRGFGRIGGEFWELRSAFSKINRQGGFTILGQYSDWGRTSMGNSAHELLFAGPDGALPTLRLEVVHEGAQEAEARVLIERALLEQAAKLSLDGQPAAETCRKLQDLLDYRARLFIAYRRPLKEYYGGCGWQDLNAKLYEAAGKVAKALAVPVAAKID